MPTNNRSLRLAVLIDADNVSARFADGLFEEIATIGEASVRRIYGDFLSSRSKSWVEVLSKHAIIAQQQFANTIGKNASDIALVIDAMDLLHTGRFDGFCLVSSDSDFTRLASRIREQGVDVFGFGEQKTPESFRQSCRRFFYTENLLPHGPEEAVPASAPLPLYPLSKAVPILKKAITQIDSEDGWANLGEVGNRLANLASDFDSRSYGYAKLSDLVRKTNCFDIVSPSGGAMRIRLRKAKPNAGAHLKVGA
ncbi:NYN domain-containing protein [Devosia faecipullorum]|uniref:NYN domain-containing protein n=1 Tax=Devosia faecipullorum TaxID=2755039 RepID=UPI00187B3BDB|nr:NYN domain-containing protein [Devosia faecipullorum]MBE7733967.1 NYN domain-containing protein [Devosia faecipullorum]